jgi:hypothetical protein
MGSRTDQARAEVIAAREGVGGEADELRRSALEAVDLPARAREDPVRVGALTAGGLFLVLGGPRRLLGRLRRAVFGAPAPRTLLPEEIEQAVEGLGRDRDTVRRHLDREFADYLEARKAEREKTLLSGTLLALAGTAVNAVAQRAGRELIESFLAAPRRDSRSTAPTDGAGPSGSRPGEPRR